MMILLAYPDYDNCIINIISSLRKYYRTSAAYPTIPELDRQLGGFYKNVVLIMFNGMGMDMLESNLSMADFLRQRCIGSVTSVFPSARTASYISAETGLSPNEHGWLGHNLFFKEFCRCVSVFKNCDSYSRQPVAQPNVAQFIMPHESIFKDIKRSVIANVQPFTIAEPGYNIPENGNYHKTAESQKRLFELINLICETRQHTFTFVQWNEAAEAARKEGCASDGVYNCLKSFSDNLEAACERLSDTLFIVSAGHGMIDIYREIAVHHQRELMECMTMPPDIEGRAMSFFVKPERKADFNRIFTESFAEDFILMPKPELMRKELFGRGKNHPKVSDFTGDFVACGISDKILRYRSLNEKPHPAPMAACGGLTESEMIVPLITVSTKKTLEYRPPMLEDITPNINFYA